MYGGAGPGPGTGSWQQQYPHQQQQPLGAPPAAPPPRPGLGFGPSALGPGPGPDMNGSMHAGMSGSAPNGAGAGATGGPYLGPPPSMGLQHHHQLPPPGSPLAGSPPPPFPAAGMGMNMPPGQAPRPPPPGGYAGPPPPLGPGGQPAGYPPLMPPQHPQSAGSPPAGPAAATAAPVGGIPAHTTIFVGTISAGVTDSWLRQLLSACGNLRSFKRVNASFGFAEFVDPESVLRALAALSGKELPAMGSDADTPSARKKLTVKADEKTRKYLDQYEQGRTKTESDDEAESEAHKTVQGVIGQMADPTNVEMAQAAVSNLNIPPHLKDLPPEELPEEHRGAVLSEIEKFRQASAARDEERRRRERVQEMERIRASERAQQKGRGDDARGAASLHANGRRDGGDRQSYLRPVGFVSGSQASSSRAEEAALPPDERDARDEERRIQTERDEASRASQDAERRYQAQERNRLAHWDRELAREDAEEERRQKAAANQLRHFDEWNQEREMERDLFYVDRSRWRAQRRQTREREERHDDEDRRAQGEEEHKAQIETENFLAQQAEDMAEFERKQRAAGVLMPGAGGEHAPLKLKRVGGADGTDTPQQHGNAPAPQQAGHGVLGTLDDESELNSARRGRLAHIDLTDVNDIDAQRERVRRELPADRKELFARTPNWERLDAVSRVLYPIHLLLVPGLTFSSLVVTV